MTVTLPAPDPATWLPDAACRAGDLAVFFDPDPGQAKQTCAECPVSDRCLDYSLARPEPHGVWGGLDEDERAKERRRRLRGGLPRYMPTGPGPAPEAATPVRAPDPFTDPIGSTRRLRALVAAGYPPMLAVEVTGLSRPGLVSLRHARLARTRTSTARAIAQAYPAILRMPVPPGAQARRAEAAERGWHGPQAWEGVDIDDPDAAPRAVHTRKAA